MLNIAVVYTGIIYSYEEHFQSMTGSDITLYATDSILVLGQDYNEDIEGFRSKSCYRHNTIKVVPFSEEPEYIQKYNDTNERSVMLNKLYKDNAAKLLEKTSTPYSIVIYTHTRVIDLPKLDWSVLHDEFLNNNYIYTTPDDRFVCGSKNNMIDYLCGVNHNNAVRHTLNLKYTIEPNLIEKYNSLFGFRGFEETCDSEKYTHRVSNETKQYSFDQMKDYDTLYFSNLNLRKIHKQLRTCINRPFILVTGEGDCECPNEIFDTDEEFTEFLNWDNLKHWFCQNCLVSHPKITLMPLGLDYHTMMYYSHIRSDRGEQITPIDQEEEIMTLRKRMKPFWERIPACYGNFQYLTITKYGTSDRTEAINILPANLIYFDCKHKRRQTFINQLSFAFVVSPFGQDYECIRTWEALCLGCIPIMKHCPLDPLYEDLPVILIDNWDEVTSEFLQRKMIEFKEKHLNHEFKYEKLHKHYWVKLLQTKKDELRLK